MHSSKNASTIQKGGDSHVLDLWQNSILSKKGAIMFKKYASLLIVCFSVLLLVSACTQEPAIPLEIEALYLQYLDTSRTDNAAAVDNYCYYEIKELIPVAKEAGVYIQDYSILSWEQLTDQLWVVTADIMDSVSEESHIAYNFVGIIDGEYKVMTSARQVPPSLREGLDLTAYIPTGDAIDWNGYDGILTD